jgi:hypothetical protein
LATWAFALLLTTRLSIAQVQPNLQIRPAAPPRTNRPILGWEAPRPAAPPPAAVQPASDPLVQLMMSQPSIDMEAPVVPQAEFDPPVAPLGGRVTFRLSFNAMNEAIKLPQKLPASAGLELTQTARGQTYSYGGPRLLPRTTINYRVSASAVGTYVVPSLVVTVYNKTVSVPEARVTFVQPGSPSAREAQRLTVELPPGDIYVGQALNARIIALDPGDPSTQMQGLSQVQVNGDAFLADSSYYRVRREAVTRNGRAFPALINEMTITPIRDGTNFLTVQGHAIITRVFTGGAIPPGSLSFSNPLLESDPLPVVVKSLPKEGELPGFTGAIGSFALEPPRLSTNEVRAGDPVMLTVTVRGDGNIGRLVPPKIAPLREWQTFPPTADPSPAYVIQQRGTYGFAYTLIPLSDRLKSTPAIPFSYFDPRKNAYVSLTIPPVPITVKPAPPGVTLATPAPARASIGLDDEGERERELVLTGLAEQPGRRVSSLMPLQQRGWFPALQVLPALALGGLWLWDRRRRYLERHPEVVLKRRARRGLRRQLRIARKAAAARDPSGFVAAAVNALREASAPHAAATPEALVCADVLEELPAAVQQGPDGAMVRRFFAAADANRFGNAEVDGAELLATRLQLERLLRQLKARL